MVKEEFKSIAAVLRTTYGKEKIIYDQQSFDVWFALLGDLDYRLVEKATLEYCMTEHFPPTPSDIRAKAIMFTRQERMTEAEAWELVRKAIAKSTYNAQEEFNKLPANCQKAIGGAEVMRDAAMGSIDSLPVIQSNFIKAYRIQQKSSEEMERLPQKMRELIESASLALTGETE